jgi:hypothetical protein
LVLERFGLRFSDGLLDHVNSTVEGVLASNQIVRLAEDIDDIGGGPENCYEDGYCSPEYSSCVNCDSVGGIFDEIAPWPGGGGGGGGGGGQDKWCERRFLEELQLCNARLRYCRGTMTTRIAAFIDRVRPDRQRDEVATARTQAVAAASGSVMSRGECDEDFDICLENLQTGWEDCLAGEGWPPSF